MYSNVGGIFQIFPLVRDCITTFNVAVKMLFT